MHQVNLREEARKHLDYLQKRFQHDVGTISSLEWIKAYIETLEYLLDQEENKNES